MTDRADFGQEFNVSLPVTIRKCAAEDLPEMEWFGLFTHDRETIHDVFRRQQRGESLMLVADINGHPAGQVWIDLATLRPRSTGWLWAVRVFPWFERLGIGWLLIRGAEQALRRRGFEYAELAVDKHNPASAFYERLGYRCMGSMYEERYSDGGAAAHVPQWVYRKELVSRGRRSAPQVAGEHSHRAS